MPRNENSSSQESFKTTKTMREKAKVVSRFVVNMLKFWRVCCRKKNTTANKTIDV